MKKPKKAGKLKTKIIWAILILTVAVIITPWGRAFYKTLIILPEFIPNSPIKTANLLTRKPQVKEVEFKSENRTIYADIWYPNSSGKHPAAVLHLGVDIDRKDPRVQKVANVFARSGVITLVPNIPSLGKRRVLAESKQDLINSFEYLRSLENVKNDKVGFIAFCASGGITLLAAEDPKISNDVSYLVAINPYYDLSSLFANITLRQINDNGQTFPWQPHPKTTEIYFRETIAGLENEVDRRILYEYLLITDPEKYKAGQFTPLSQVKFNQLSKAGKHTYNGLTNRDPGKVAFYLENATDEQKKFVRELSPSTNIENLKGETFILMDKNNIYIPYTEAILLHQALNGNKHHFVETQILPAGDLVKNLPLKNYLGESVKIFGFIYGVFLKIN